MAPDRLWRSGATVLEGVLAHSMAWVETPGTAGLELHGYAGLALILAGPLWVLKAREATDRLSGVVGRLRQ